MRIFIISFLLIILSIDSQSQVTKRFDVVKTSGSYIVDRVDYDDNMNPIEHTFIFLGKNRKYAYLDEITIIYSGKSSEIIEFLNNIEIFCEKFKDENKLEGKVEGLTVFHYKMYGYRACHIYDKENNGYIEIKDSDITKYKNKIIEYCNKNNISL